MTREEIIRMAREAECEETYGADSFRFTVEELEAFARLVAAAEREAMQREGWIPCSERMPTTHGTKLVADVDRDMCGSGYWDTTEGEWDDMHYNSMGVLTVTHWRELPKGPKP